MASESGIEKVVQTPENRLIEFYKSSKFKKFDEIIKEHGIKTPKPDRITWGFMKTELNKWRPHREIPNNNDAEHYALVMSMNKAYAYSNQVFFRVFTDDTKVLNIMHDKRYYWEDNSLARNLDTYLFDLKLREIKSDLEERHNYLLECLEFIDELLNQMEGEIQQDLIDRYVEYKKEWFDPALTKVEDFGEVTAADPVAEWLMNEGYDYLTKIDEYFLKWLGEKRDRIRELVDTTYTYLIDEKSYFYTYEKLQRTWVRDIDDFMKLL